MSEQNSSAVVSLTKLLNEERAALISGDMRALRRMGDCKARLIEKIGTDGRLEKDQILALQDKIVRNQSLLKSALDGIQAVSDRMADLQRVRQGLETYDQSGFKNRVSTKKKPVLEKRA